MERFFILDKFNTYYDWGLILTGKDVTPPEPKTNYVDIDGRHGSLDLSESLTGEVIFKDRTVSASFWTCNGTHTERNETVVDIIKALHGRKIKIIEPDDLEHYFIGRVSVKNINNIMPYMEFTIEATCEPWRYSIDEINRAATVNGGSIDLVIENRGVKTLCPDITVKGSVVLNFNGVSAVLDSGTYKVVDLKLKQGANVVRVTGTGTVTFTYREAWL